MQLNKKTMGELAEQIANAVVKALEKRGAIGQCKSNRTAYSKTESLLYNYRGFKKIVQERLREIEELRKYGVPQKSGSIVQYTPHTGTVGSIVLPEESVENAVKRVEESVVDTVKAIELVDKGMRALQVDPYYKVLEMRYFEGRSQEDIAMVFGCSQATISNNQNRLVRELSMQLFPNQVADEIIN